jgi:hypothetical protein
VPLYCGLFTSFGFTSKFVFFFIEKRPRSWSQKFVGSIRLQLAVAREVIHKLELAQDLRRLSVAEDTLHREIKMKCLGLASLSRTIARQRLRIMFLREGDTNTKFFHLQAYHRCCKKHITQISHHGMVLTSEDDKAQAIFDYFDQILGTQVAWTHGVDYAALGLPQTPLMLYHCFSEEEVWAIIRDMAPDKSPGPDGFTRRFYQSAWSVIKHDVLQALAALCSLNARNFYLLIQSYMILLHKKQNVEEIKDFLPISLIHNFGKLLTKILSAHLAPHMAHLVLPNRSAFI